MVDSNICFQIIVAGMGLPWLGYTVGLLLAMFCRQPIEDVLAISVETGVHNTGISIFMLRFALSQPEADLTTGKLTISGELIVF